MSHGSIQKKKGGNMRTKIVSIFLFLFYTILPKDSLDKEYSIIYRGIERMLGEIITADFFDYTKKPYDSTVLQTIQTGLSRRDAILFALKRNAGLKAELANIEIAHGFLIQESLYSNPRLENIVRFPLQNTNINIEADFTFKISDLWQIPFDKRVAQSMVRATTYAALFKALLLIKDVQIAYDYYLGASLRLASLYKELEAAEALFKQEKARQSYGYPNEAEITQAQALVAATQIKIAHERIEQQTALYNLLAYMALQQPIRHLNASDNFRILTFIPDNGTLKKCAFEFRPDLLMWQTRIEQYQGQQKAQKAKILDNVELGISYKKDLELPTQRGVGPRFGLNIPFFDLKDGDIRQAQAFEQQACYMIKATQVMINKDIEIHSVSLKQLNTQLQTYSKDQLPSLHKRVHYYQTYAQHLQQPAPLLFKAAIDFYHAQQEYIMASQMCSQELARLEFTIASRLH